jgi:L-2-hydroxyglutarate oxidase
MTYTADTLIIGAGIIGLTLAYTLKKKYPDLDIIILEKETEVAKHGSGRNSGVIHAGFYYTPDSLKAKLTALGNQKMKAFCCEHSIPMRECGKVVIAQNETEQAGIHELHRRGGANGVRTQIINKQELAEIEPNAKTCEIALFSPDTASVNPVNVCLKLKDLLIAEGVQFLLGEAYVKRSKKNTILTSKNNLIQATKIINSGGLYADKIARDFGLSQHYTILPFKGIYLKYTLEDQPLRTHVYPVPNLNNPFLGVHFTLTVDGDLKIGPTAIPAFWRENYQKLQGFDLRECTAILALETRLWCSNAFQFRALAREEMRKYNKHYLVSEALKMVKSIRADGFQHWSTPGIRAQLLDKRDFKLVQDFVVEENEESLHILNAVSPAFTGSFAFAEWCVEKYLDL